MAVSPTSVGGDPAIDQGLRGPSPEGSVPAGSSGGGLTSQGSPRSLQEDSLHRDLPGPFRRTHFTGISPVPSGGLTSQGPPRSLQEDSLHRDLLGPFRRTHFTGISPVPSGGLTDWGQPCSLLQLAKQLTELV
ncbi:hypothetical protein NHX12_019062 [Muraenolepis orangiensis]|uniref:Uncharacterized protein n=1 Tax=Muraenolepis orangiensis TaxID=630683 RepID=A0A9Q0IVQ4_9TELE|nr:hypothetical protein NHX12_019062 [Muraenolepis orangiensis]